MAKTWETENQQTDVSTNHLYGDSYMHSLNLLLKGIINLALRGQQGLSVVAKVSMYLYLWLK